MANCRIPNTCQPAGGEARGSSQLNSAKESLQRRADRKSLDNSLHRAWLAITGRPVQQNPLFDSRHLTGHLASQMAVIARSSIQPLQTAAGLYIVVGIIACL